MILLFTDVVNGVLMTIGTILALGFLIIKVGGFSEIILVSEPVGSYTFLVIGI